MAETSYDVIVLGSGPGGYVAAIRCAQLGLKTAIVERELLGGICLNWGCIPTKALLRSAEIFHYMQHAGDYGLKAKEIEADIQAVVKRSRGVAKQLNQGVTHLMKKNKIAVHMGEGTLTGPTSLTVKGEKGDEKLTARHVIVATGARARELPFAKSDGKRVWTYRHAMTPTEMPNKLLIIGSGAIGIEFASFYNDMGAEVTVVEMLDRVVPVEDADVSAFLEKSLAKQGMTIMTGAGVEALAVSGTGREGEDQGQGRYRSPKATSAMSSLPSGSYRIPGTSASKSSPRWTAASSRSIPTAALGPRDCGRSATVRRAHGWRTRRATRASPPRRRSRRSWATRTSIRTRLTATTYRAARTATRRSPASA